MCQDCSPSFIVNKKASRSSLKKYDPTHTTSLRNAFVRDMNKRFDDLAKEVSNAIIKDDVFGLEKQKLSVFVSPGAKAFQFGTSQQKADQFMEWFNKQVSTGILETKTLQGIGTSINEAWTNKYVSDSYKRGVQRGHDELNGSNANIPSLDSMGGIQAAMMNPFHIDRLGVIYSRVFSDLQGITAAMDTQISRVLAQGMADGDGPRLLAKKINNVITGAGGDLGMQIKYINKNGNTVSYFMPAKRRAEILARTEVIRAHHLATIQEYRNWAVEGVIVQAEFRTAGDARVCPQCSELQGKVFTLDEVEYLIPVHPQCRCVTIPKVVDTTESTAPIAVEPIQEVVKDKIETAGPWKDALTVKDLVAEFKKRNIVFENPLRGEATMTATEIERANMVGKCITDEILLRLPKVRQALIDAKKSMNLYLDNNKKVKFRSINVLAHYINKDKLIEVAGQTMARTTPTLQVGVGHNVGTDLASVIRHEYGHYVDMTLMKYEDRVVWMQVYKRTISTDVSKQDLFAKSPYFKKFVSDYSGTDYLEAFAESFAAYTSPLYNTTIATKRLPKEIEQIFQKIIGDIKR